jgi:hypothetical protein
VHHGRVADDTWDEEATGMPDPWAHLRGNGASGYGPEGEIFLMGNFAGGVRRATGWRRLVGVSVTALLLASILGSAFVSILELASGPSQSHSRVVQGPANLP